MSNVCVRGKIGTYVDIFTILNKKPTKNQINEILEIFKEAIENSLPTNTYGTTVEESTALLLEKQEDDNYEMSIEFSLTTFIDGVGTYTRGNYSGPPEDCYPDWFESNLDDIEFDRKNAESSIKNYFYKYEPISDINLLEVSVNCGSLDVDENEIVRDGW